MLSKDVQDQAGAVHDPYVVTQRLFQVPQLARGKLLVKDDKTKAQIVAQFEQLFDFARADQSSRVKAIQALPRLPGDLEAGSLGQLAQLGQRVLDLPAAPFALELRPNQQDPFGRSPSHG